MRTRRSFRGAPGITDPRTAHELTGGTFTLGIGAGGVIEKPIAAVRAYVREVRGVAKDLPIIVGALGPQMLRLSGREANGAALRPLLAKSPTRDVVVQCADGVSHGTFVSVLDEAKLEGAGHIAVVGR